VQHSERIGLTFHYSHKNEVNTLRYKHLNFSVVELLSHCKFIHVKTSYVGNVHVNRKARSVVCMLKYLNLNVNFLNKKMNIFKEF